MSTVPVASNFSGSLHQEHLMMDQIVDSTYVEEAMHREQNFLELLYLSYMPLCIAIGLTGNCMVFVLIRSNRIFRKLPSSAYLLTLSLMSSIFLLSLLSFWVEESFKDQTYRHSMILCKGGTFLAHFCDFASVWLIVCVGFERLTLLYRASLRRRSLVYAKRHVFALLIASALCNMWILFVAEINEYGSCDIKPNYEGVYNAFSVSETIICMILPSIFIILSNFFVILKLRAHMKQIPSSPAVSFNTADTVYYSQSQSQIKLSKATNIAGAAPTREQLDEQKASLRRRSLRHTDIQLTRSLLVVTSVFILLNLPNYVYRIGIQFLMISDQTAQMQRLSLAAHVLLYTHHACLFYLYIFNSPQMRKRLVPTALKLLECYCLKPHVHEFSLNSQQGVVAAY